MHLSDFDALFCKAAAHAAGSRQHATVGDSPCTVFLVSEVVNASGGRTGCFLYRGRLLTPAPRSCTPDCCPWPGGAETGRPGSLDDQRVVPQLGADEELCWAELEGQNLTLYLSYEEASPKMKRRVQAAGTPAAPWRVALRDAQDDLVFSLRGLPQEVQVDEEARMAVWGPQVAVAFPSAEDTRDFAERLCAVAVQRCSLAGSPQAALLEAHAAEQRLRDAPAAMAAAKSAVVPAARAQALPPASPDLLAATPRVGCKRPAATPLPQALTTPVVKARLLSSASLETPKCAAQLLA